MSTVKFVGEECQWGTKTTHGSGTVVDENLTKAAQLEPVENSQGARVGLVFYDEAYNGNITVVASASGDAPETGGVITILSTTLYITNVQNRGQHKGKRMYVITAEGGKNLAEAGAETVAETVAEAVAEGGENLAGTGA